MDPDLGSRDAKASSAAQGASVEAQLGDQVMLAEYSALRSEVDRRVNLQWNVVALQVTSAGVIASLAIGTGGIRPTAGPLACRDRQVASASSHTASIRGSSLSRFAGGCVGCWLCLA